MSDIEFETTLIVVADQPESVFGRISTLTELAGLTLSEPETKALRDVYFDTVGGELSDRMFALRLRISESIKIALKGPTSASQRTEIEGEWPGAIDAVYKALDQLAVTLGRPASDCDDPLEALKLTGLQIIHDRKNERTTLLLRAGNQDIGEIVLDRVTYLVSGLQIGHYEIEVEAYESCHIEQIQQASNALMNMFKPQVIEADIGKLALGLLLEQLQVEGALRASLTPQNTIRPDAYPTLLKRLRLKE
ncbi:MAG: CYTH domain-containing protein [Planctomycetota bacterium]|nr:CYTH domain-containing protein [Planctomycetota bacterium]MDA1137566.1 CYTH domain-containing protein [Planctomycetota bacterium]